MKLTAMKLTDAARVFVYEIPKWLPDETKVGEICGVPVHAGEVRRLSIAIIDEERKNLIPNSQDEIILSYLKGRNIIEAIKYRRSITTEGLKEAKDYVESLGERHGLRRKVNGLLGPDWEWA